MPGPDPGMPPRDLSDVLKGLAQLDEEIDVQNVVIERHKAKHRQLIKAREQVAEMAAAAMRAAGGNTTYTIGRGIGYRLDDGQPIRCRVASSADIEVPPGPEIAPTRCHQYDPAPDGTCRCPECQAELEAEARTSRQFLQKRP